MIYIGFFLKVKLSRMHFPKKKKSQMPKEIYVTSIFMAELLLITKKVIMT